jgi:uncharacterized membrane protein YeaQ/YmgE (transglycosylase-associated protein family)
VRLRTMPPTSSAANRMFAAAPSPQGFASRLSDGERCAGRCRRSIRQRESIMSLFSWIVLGLVAGFIASRIVNRTGEGVIVDILLGIVGAVAGGWLFRLFGMPGASGLNVYSSVIAIIGAALVLLIYHTMFRSFRNGRV